MDNKRNATGLSAHKVPCCFNEIDGVLREKPTTFPAYLTSSSGSFSLLNTPDSATFELPKPDEINFKNEISSVCDNPVNNAAKNSPEGSTTTSNSIYLFN